MGRNLSVQPVPLHLCFSFQAGQYSAFFVYLRLVMGFTEKETALFIGVVGLLSVVAQTAGLTILMKTVGNKNTIIIGLGENKV